VERYLATQLTLQEIPRHLSSAAWLLPADEESAPSSWQRIRFVPYVIIPWLALYALTSKLASHGVKFGMPFEDRLPIIGWTALFYQSIYVVIALAPWWVRTRRDLRRLIISSWIAMAVIFPFYWLVPSSAPRRPLLGHDWITQVLGAERTAFPPIAAFPSFHVLWAVFLARAFRPRWMGWTYVAIIAVSCITTGQHYIADVVSSMIIAPAFVEPERMWRMRSYLTEGLATSPLSTAARWNRAIGESVEFEASRLTAQRSCGPATSFPALN
jgi:PAP2 superfamily